MGGKFLCSCAKAGSVTTADSGVTVATGTAYDLRIEVAADNSATKFYINNTLVATITTNLLIGDAWTAVSLKKTAGTTNTGAYVDYMEWSVDR